MRIRAPRAALLLLLAASMALAALPACHGHAYLMVRQRGRAPDQCIVLLQVNIAKHIIT